MKILSISIVLYKTSIYQLRNCIQSLVCVEDIADLYLIDNSPNSKLEKQKDLFKDTKYFFINSNLGYARGHNKALDIASNKKYKYHLILNADCYFQGAIIDKLVRVMNNNLEIGLIMPKILNPDGSIQKLCKFIPNPIDLIGSYLIKILHFESILKPNHLMADKIYEHKSFVPYLSGCFMLMRWSSLREVGFFDSKFFMYAEDIDLSRRMAEKYLTIYYPGTYVFHEHGKGSFKDLKLLLIHLKNICIYFNKWGWINDSKRNYLNNKAKYYNSQIL